MEFAPVVWGMVKVGPTAAVAAREPGLGDVSVLGHIVSLLVNDPAQPSPTTPATTKPTGSQNGRSGSNNGGGNSGGTSSGSGDGGGSVGSGSGGSSTNGSGGNVGGNASGGDSEGGGDGNTDNSGSSSSGGGSTSVKGDDSSGSQNPGQQNGAAANSGTHSSGATGSSSVANSAQSSIGSTAGAVESGSKVAAILPSPTSDAGGNDSLTDNGSNTTLAVPGGLHTSVRSAALTSSTNGSGSGPGGTDRSDASDPVLGQSENDGDKRRISAGAISGIVILLCLVFFALAFFVFRRRSVVSRHQRRVQWNSPWRGSDVHSAQMTETERTMLGTDSFVTISVPGSTLNLNSAHPEVDESVLPVTYPSRPQPALLHASLANGSLATGGQRDESENQRRNPMSISFVDSLGTPPVQTLADTASQDSMSCYSMTQESMSQEFETRTAHGAACEHDEEADEVRSIRVRPFTPSESFMFPKPPSRPATADNAIAKWIVSNLHSDIQFRPMTADAAITRKTTFERPDPIRPRTADVSFPRPVTPARLSSLMRAPSYKNMRPASARTPNPFLSNVEVASVAESVKIELEVGTNNWQGFA